MPGQEISLHAAMLLLRGKAYDALENQQRAARWYKAALQADPFCYEAFQVLATTCISVPQERKHL